MAESIGVAGWLAGVGDCADGSVPLMRSSAQPAMRRRMLKSLIAEELVSEAIATASVYRVLFGANAPAKQ